MNLEKIDQLLKVFKETENEYVVIITNKQTIDELVDEKTSENIIYENPEAEHHKLRGIFRNGISMFFIDREDIDMDKFSDLTRKTKD